MAKQQTINQTERRFRFVAPGEFGGVKSFTSDDGTIRRMWSIDYMGGKINGFFGQDSQEVELFDYLSSVPVGTPARAFGRIDSSADEVIKLSAESFTIQGADGFEPLTDSEFFNGCVFRGLGQVWDKQIFKGSPELRVNSVGNSFHFRNIPQEVFQRVESGSQYVFTGLLRTSLVFVGARRFPQVGVNFHIMGAIPFALEKN